MREFSASRNLWYNLRMNRETLNNSQFRFLTTLIENRKEISLEEIEARGKALRIHIPEAPLIVAVVEIDFGEDFKNRDALITRVQKTLNRQISVMKLEGYALANSRGNFWLLLHDNEQLDDALNQICENLESDLKLEAFVGIGRRVDSVQKLNVSAAEAQEILQYRNSDDRKGVIDINDMVQFAYRSRVGSNHSYQKVISSFIVGNITQMETELNVMIEEIRYTPKVSKSSIRRAMIELTVNVLNIASNMNVDVDAILNGTDPYTWIISQNHTEVITAWFMELCQKLIISINELRQKSEISVVQQACRYIDENLSDCSLGLASTSESVGLTSPYLSQLFKKEMGVGLNAYITNQRLEKAKNLLKNTTMKMDEIALSTGFNSASYFNQVFKKETGITPTQYRES